MNEKQIFCFEKEGEDIYLFTLRNNSGTEVCITNYGAIVTSFKVKQSNGSTNDIVIGFDKVEDYLSSDYLNQYAYFGAACGRYANRIKKAGFVIDGQYYHLSENAGTNQLHGGIEGFDKKTWQLVSVNDSFLELKYLSKDGEEGFPGNLETFLRFELNDQNELSYEFSATTDMKTVVNLTHHSYFNLNNGTGTIEEHEVKINSSTILAQDEEQVCNGEYVSVENTPFDFRNYKSISKDWDKKKGYDHCFVIDNKSEGLELVAEIRSLKSGVILQIFSTEPVVQFYTAQGLPIIKGKQGIQYSSFSGLCLETHKHPNAANIPHFPNTILRPGEIYSQKNIYKVSEAEVK